MSSAVTRAYLRGRLVAVLVGFVVAVTAGMGFSLWQAEQAKTKLKFGMIVGYMAESTSDVIYHALRLDHSRHRAAPFGVSRRGGGTSGRRAHDSGAGSGLDQIRSDLRAALGRLGSAYQALEFSAEGDVGMLESRRITRQEATAPDESQADSEDAMISGISGLEVPHSVQGLWDGTGNSYALKDDVRQVITLANRLDIFRDYSNAAAQRVFVELQALANGRVRPNLSETLDLLHSDMRASYGALQYTLVFVAISMVAAGVLTGLGIFEPMTRKIAEAHESLLTANESVEAAKLRAEAADRAKSEFLANMSHEIRTPMNGVLGMAELLAKTELDSRQKTFTDVIVKSGNALLTIINDILDFSRIDAGQMEISQAPFRLAEAVEDVATLVSAKVAEKDLELIVRVDPRLPAFVNGDVGRFRQIITNLTGNAVKFTEKGHVLVDVSGKVEAGVANVTVRVEDTGIGIPEEKLTTVFGKFAQVDASSTRRHEGTGLGLAIASRLVQLMDGQIGAESRPGRGSAFWFTMPLPVHDSNEPERPVPFDVSGSRVLVIDDNPVNRSILLEQLRNWGFDCAAAEDGMMGLAFLDKAAELGATVDCVILDYQMPGMNGAEVASAVRSRPSAKNLPVVLLTSVDQADFGRLIVQHGIAAHLTKPARSSLLLETLVAVLQRARNDPASAAPLRLTAAMMRRADQSAPASAPEPRPAAVKNKLALDILVAEDNEVNQLVFSQILDGLGLSYRIAGNGRTAMEMQRAFSPRAILMDVSMPEMNGYEATAAIRVAEKGSRRRTPIIGVTAHALKGDREKCLDAGMDDYLSKPISPDKLAAKIEHWLSAGAVAQSA
jgi:signal transduction histidine kinase/DNA-binding response OmpR family regulator